LYSPKTSRLLSHSANRGKSSFSTTLRFTFLPSSNLNTNLAVCYWFGSAIAFLQRGVYSIRILPSICCSYCFPDLSFCCYAYYSLNPYTPCRNQRKSDLLLVGLKQSYIPHTLQVMRLIIDLSRGSRCVNSAISRIS
jgi:hypothetical protein